MDALKPDLEGRVDLNEIDEFPQFNSARLIYGEGTSKRDWLQWDGINQLKGMDLESEFRKDSRIIILSPHPDDEILGCAGLIQGLDLLRREVVIVAVTNGTQSHPYSKKYSAEELSTIRPNESRRALKSLHLTQNIQYLSFELEDGKLLEQVKTLEQKLHQLINKKLRKKHNILVTTYEKDGHPDHECLGRCVREFAEREQLKCYQVLIWAWHWAKPMDPQIAWKSAQRLDLNQQFLDHKAIAIKCFESQTEDDLTTQQPAILPTHVIDRILMPFEVYIHVE